MRRTLFLMISVVGLVALIAAGAGSAKSHPRKSHPRKSQDFICSDFIGVVHARHDLIVPRGKYCGPTEGSTIGHDAIVRENASFFPGGTTIGHDVLAHRAKLVELGDPNNGTSDTIVGHDVIIKGTQGHAPFGQFVCQTRIGHDLIITHTARGVAQWYIGAQDPSNCGRNYGRGGDTIGHDGIFANNANTMYVSDNNPQLNGGTGPGFGHDLIFVHNHGGVHRVTDNTIGHNCRQRNNHPYFGAGNTARHSVDDCNSSNP